MKMIETVEDLIRVAVGVIRFGKDGKFINQYKNSSPALNVIGIACEDQIVGEIGLRRQRPYHSLSRKFSERFASRHITKSELGHIFSFIFIMLGDRLFSQMKKWKSNYVLYPKAYFYVTRSEKSVQYYDHVNKIQGGEIWFSIAKKDIVLLETIGNLAQFWKLQRLHNRAHTFSYQIAKLVQPNSVNFIKIGHQFKSKRLQMLVRLFRRPTNKIFLDMQGFEILCWHLNKWRYLNRRNLPSHIVAEALFKSKIISGQVYRAGFNPRSHPLQVDAKLTQLLGDSYRLPVLFERETAEYAMFSLWHIEYGSALRTKF